MKEKCSIEGISEGDMFLCFNECRYNNDSKGLIFEYGHVYESHKPGYITDYLGNHGHKFTHNYWTNYVLKICDLKADRFDMIWPYNFYCQINWF